MDLDIQYMLDNRSEALANNEKAVPKGVLFDYTEKQKE